VNGVALGIIGAGAFGTALADVVATRGISVMLHGDDPEVVEGLRRDRTNEKRLPGVTVHEGVRVTGELAEVARATRLLLLAVPSPRVVDTVKRLGDVVDGRHMIVHAIGAPVEPVEMTGRTVSQVLRDETPVKRIGALAGPALARDLTARRPCAVVIASPFDEVIAATRAALSAPPVLRVYGGRDLQGVELASALSGALTVAVGLADGLGVGAGPRAVLVSRGVAECTRLVALAGGAERTFVGLAGLGNLLVRTSSASAEWSSDYQLGVQLARGGAPRESEGTRAAQSGALLGRRHHVRTPILDAVVQVAIERVPVKQAAAKLLENVSEEE
jgi:glycerol-3-phosphate dehydrogenase (NAD(P)+)